MASSRTLPWVCRITMPPNGGHSTCEYFEGNGLGEVFFAPFDVIFSEHDVAEPDILVVVKPSQFGSLTPAHGRLI